MRQEIWKTCLILALAGLIGLVVGYPLLVMLVITVGVIIWNIYRIELMRRWLTDAKNNPYPAENSQFHELYRLINRRNVKNTTSKRKLASYLKQFRKAASVLPDAVVLIDEFGKITWANGSASELFSIQWPSDLGVKFTDLIRDPDVEKLLENDFIEATTEQRETKYTSKFNEDITINIRVAQYTEKLRMVIGSDISNLLKVNKVQSDFVANVSHELKTPLTVLKGYIDIMLNKPDLPTELSSIVGQMETQSNRMELIIGDLLYLAKLESQNNQATHKPVDITSIINTAIETIDEKLTEKHLKLELDIDYKLKILGSHTELHAAFSNLIFNAVNYTPNHGVINISWQQSRDSLSFSVQDNGNGIPESQISRLTERFYRVDSDRSRGGGGTGLGLAIVKHVLHRHNAILEIDSQIGVGSKFTCIFPVKQTPNQQIQELS